MVHARRLDQDYVLKVADFGLSENTYAKSYIRKNQTAGVKLPVKWMAYESLIDGIFSEKTDVVSSISYTQTFILAQIIWSLENKVTVCINNVLQPTKSLQSQDRIIPNPVLLITTYLHVVVIWSDMLGDLQHCQDTLSWHPPNISDCSAEEWREAPKAR